MIDGGDGTSGSRKAYTFEVVGTVEVAYYSQYATFSGIDYMDLTLTGSGTLLSTANHKILEGGSNQTITINGPTLQGPSGNGPIVNARGGTITLQSGTIRGGNYVSGRGVCVEGGTFIMSGGSITGNTVTGGGTNGAGVYVFSGTFTMTGGVIGGNKATQPNTKGAGVYVRSGTFNKTGGIIYGMGEGDNSNLCGGGLAGTGQAVYHESGSKYRDSTSGNNDNISGGVSGYDN